MRFRTAFIATVLAAALVLAAVLLNSRRPALETDQPTAAHVAATGKCASCHREESGAVVHEFERSAHARAGVTCLDCHNPAQGQEATDHRGFTISTELSAKNCATCHGTQYEQFLRSRHAAPAWAAVAGRDDFTPEQLNHAEKYHPGAVDRTANVLAIAQGDGVRTAGCDTCHSVGQPNPDGSVGSCTECHSRHAASIELARQPATCGQCHMGPDHSQLEIFNESKHGVMYRAQQHTFNLAADPKMLSTRDMPVPNCATCHMSGLEGVGVTHDVTERLSWYLFAPTSDKRPGYTAGQDKMKEVCGKCHTQAPVDEMYATAEEVVAATNVKVARVHETVASLHADGVLTPEPFDEPIEFLEFDYWHYYGRTAKHGAFMGGADFVQWHGNYELLKLGVEIEQLAEELRAEHATATGDAAGADEAADPAEAP